MKNQIFEERQMRLPIEDLARSNISTVFARKAELQEAREEFNSLLETNEDYKRACKLIKEAQDEKKAAKKRALQKPEVIRQEQKVKDLSFDLKEAQTTLAELLLQFTEETGNKEIVDVAGATHEIKIKATIKV